MDYETRCVKNQNELEEAYELFAKSFPPDYYSAKNLIFFYLENEKDIKFSNHIICLHNGKIVSALRIVDRLISYFGIPVKVGGMSFFATDYIYRKSGVGKLVRNYWLDYFEKNYDINIGFARKVMDGYWSRFGYVGYSSYTNIQIKFSDIQLSISNLNLIDYNDKYLHEIKKLYNDIHLKNNIEFLRSDSSWDLIFLKLSLNIMKSDMKIITNNLDEVVGYFILENGSNKIIELVGKEENYRDILSCLTTLLQDKFNEFIFECSPSHTFFKFLNRFNHSYTIRKAWDGGHYCKFPNVYDFLNKINPLLKSRLLKSNLPPFNINLSNLNFFWNGVDLNINEVINQGTLNDMDFPYNEWQKLIMGSCPFDQIENSFSKDSVLEIGNVLFPVLYPVTLQLNMF